MREKATVQMKSRLKLPALLLILAVLLTTGCATPVGVNEISPRFGYERLTTSALREDGYSYYTAKVLYRYDYVDAFKDGPAEVLDLLYRKSLEDYRSDVLFALAELHYLTGSRAAKKSGDPARRQSRKHYLSASIFAYYYLFGEDWIDPPGPFDRRYRVAADLYNVSLGLALTDKEGQIDLSAMDMDLPIGRITLSLQSDGFSHSLSDFDSFVLADRYAIRGLSIRNRIAGLGTPIIAVQKKAEGAPAHRTLPVSLFMRVNCRLDEIGSDTCKGVIELYTAFDHSDIQMGAQSIPLERDLTAPLAYALEQPYLWDIGMSQFFKGQGYIKNGVYLLQPYDPDKIPVVFVHGTLSSPVWWAEMINTLRSDPLLMQKYQIWFYIYDSGKKILFSALDLRDFLRERIAEFDPDEKNPNLRKMVIVGHSQGGILTKLTAVDTGDTILRMVTNKSLDEIDATPEQRETLKKYSMVEPLPFVKRVVFISTPHRGSFLAKDWVSRLLRRFLSLPKDILQSTVSIASALASAGASEEVLEKFKLGSSLDGMSPKNKALLAIADMPLANGIKGHSIIAIDGKDNPPEGDDGVVKYTSAHIDGVESEFIVRSGHSCQGHPLVIEEVRRILLEHLKDD